MSVPAVSLTELDGQLGIVPTSAGQLCCIVGDAQSGPLNTPAAFARAKDVLASFTGGPLVEDALYAIEHYGKVVVLCRTDRTTDGAAGSVDVTAVVGTAVPTVDTSTLKPWYSGEWVFQILTAGILGTEGIAFRYSDDGGRNWSKKKSLGTALNYTVDVSGVKVVFGASSATLLVGDEFSFLTTEPKWDATDLADALAAARLSNLPIEFCSIAGSCSGTEKGTINTAADACHASNRHRFFVCSARRPAVGESEAAYLASLETDFADKEHTSVVVCAGAARIGQSVPGRTSSARRSPRQAVSPRIAKVSGEYNIAQILPYGALPGVSLKDANGNPVEHDEEANPGLDDAGFLTLRSFANRGGVFVNRPRVQAPAGSDFELLPYRRVMNDARTAVQAGLELRVLNATILVKKTTGYILESEALDIEAALNSILDRTLLRKPKASAAVFVLSRTDNILATKTLHYSVRITPVGYAEIVEGDIALVNPANVVSV